jgi:hypothetical protein
MLYSGDRSQAGAYESGEDRFGDERLVAFEEIVGRIAARALPAYRKPGTWLERVRVTLLTLLEFCDEQPELAQEVVVDSIAWGPRVLECRSRLLVSLADALEEGQDGHDALGPSQTDTAENLVGACISMIHMRLVQGGASFTELAPSLMSMIVQLYLGAEASRHELERPLTQMGAEAVECAPRGSTAGLRETRY